MEFLLILLAGPVLMGLVYFGLGLGKPKALSTSSNQVLNPGGLSEVAQQVYKEYMSLPAESRPFDSIKDILMSLDKVTQHRAASRRNHFDANAYSRERYSYYPSDYPYKFGWSDARHPHGCDHKDCEFKAYYALHVEIERVKKALAEKAQAMVESDNAHNVAMAEELVKALRDEAGIQQKVTAELRS